TDAKGDLATPIPPATSQNSQAQNNDAFTQDADKSQFKNAITTLKNRGVVNGYDDGTFKPFNPINRAEFMKIVIGASGKQPHGDSCFKDVQKEWFAGYVCKGWSDGIVGGYPDGSFKPEQQINVAEALKITLKAFGIETREASSGEAWHAPFVQYAQNAGYWLNTFDSNSKQLTREDMAELVYRLMPSE
ncbi:MAG: S-layer homology domain-containing protein, partial [Patescibacteria group bacterium]